MRVEFFPWTVVTGIGAPIGKLMLEFSSGDNSTILDFPIGFCLSDSEGKSPKWEHRLK